MNKILKFLLSIILSFLLFSTLASTEEEKIKIGLLIPMSGENKNLGEQIIKATRLALKDINNNRIEIYPKDTKSNPKKTLSSAIELKQKGINLVIGPVFYKSTLYLDEINDVTFLSLTNKTLDLPKNIISSGVNSTSQLNTIKKFIKANEIKKTIFLTPDLDYNLEIKKGIKNSKIKILKEYNYSTDPTKLTKQIEKITNYEIRKQNLIDEIERIENSDENNKEVILEKLKKKYTLGKVKFEAIIIADFEESLKSVITSLLYSDVSPKNKFFITFNQWFDESLLKEPGSQPIYYPSINQKNLEDFKRKFFNEFNQEPNHLSLLSYDLVGLVYYLSLNTDLSNINKIFKKKNSFKGKIGVFEIENNKINHKLNFYEINDGAIKEIF